MMQLQLWLQFWLRLQTLSLAVIVKKSKIDIPGKISDIFTIYMYMPNDQGRSQNRSHTFVLCQNRTNLLQLRSWLRLRLDPYP
jgi:hypothetical protein